MMTRDALVRLAVTVAREHDLDPPLVLAIIEQESAWDPWAMREERAFYEKWVSPLVANGNLSNTEARLRSFSFGLMQVMGQTARDTAGFAGKLPTLLDPEINLHVGCVVLQKKLQATDGDRHLALLKWNGGANTKYPGQVLARLPHYVDISASIA